LELSEYGAIGAQAKTGLPNRKTNPLLKPMRNWLFLSGLFLIAALRAVLLLPSALDFRNFAFRDLGSFQHLNRLIALGLRPGLDFGFPYGLLGVLIQHFYFAAFGEGHWPTVGLLIIYMLSMLTFWFLLCLEIGPSTANFGILLGLAGMAIYIAPWPPTPAHILMQLSLCFALYFLFKNRLSLALFIAVLGALAHPAMPIALAGLITLAIAWQWWQMPDRTVRGLAAQFVPAAAGYAAIVALMVPFFGWRSVLKSLLPLTGAAHYRAMHFGFFRSGRYFWDPPDRHLGYYLFTPAGIWLLCSALLVALACMTVLRTAGKGSLQGRSLFVVVCCALHLVFIFALYGNYLTYVFYVFLLAAGVLVGISELANPRLKIALSCSLLVLGLLSQVNGVKEGLQTWRTGSVSAATANLYAPNDFQSEWKSVLSIAKNRHVFLVAYATGVDTYYPEIGSPQSWMLLPGITLPREDAYVLKQIRSSDIVVEEREVTTRYIDQNREWQTALEDFPVVVSGRYFRIWSKDPATRAELLETASFHSNK
jgi:hypothetical protein